MMKKSKNPETKASVAGIFLNFIIALFKLIAGYFSGSIATRADALNNLSDSGTSLISYLGFRIAAKPPDRRHPFGHARMEYIISLLISFLILLVGTRMFSDSVAVLIGLEEKSSPNMGIGTLTVLAVSLLVKLCLGFIYLIAYKKNRSKVMRASVIDSFTDVISTLAVIASGIIISCTGFVLLDSIVGLAVSLLIIAAGVKILLETKDALLGQAPAKDIEEKIKSIAKQYPKILNVHDLLIHSYGPSISMASFHAEIDGTGSIYELHDVIDSLEREIKKALGISATVHIDPISKDDAIRGKHLGLISDILNTAGLDFEMHDFRVYQDESNVRVFFDLVVPYEYKLTDEQIIERVCSEAQKTNPEILLVIEIDRG